MTLLQHKLQEWYRVGRPSDTFPPMATSNHSSSFEPDSMASFSLRYLKLGKSSTSHRHFPSIWFSLLVTIYILCLLGKRHSDLCVAYLKKKKKINSYILLMSSVLKKKKKKKIIHFIVNINEASSF